LEIKYGFNAIQIYCGPKSILFIPKSMNDWWFFLTKFYFAIACKISVVTLAAKPFDMHFAKCIFRQTKWNKNFNRFTVCRLHRPESRFVSNTIDTNYLIDFVPFWTKPFLGKEGGLLKYLGSHTNIWAFKGFFYFLQLFFNKFIYNF
jgi:hypothetical protein